METEIIQKQRENKEAAACFLFPGDSQRGFLLTTIIREP